MAAVDMKWLIASDIHGSAPCCRKLLRAWEQEGADRLLLLGDLLSAGPWEGDKKAVAEMLNSLAESITAVQGNCDSGDDLLLLDFPLTDDYVTVYLPSRRMFATHGHLYNTTCLPEPMEEGDILLTGHTHVPATQQQLHFLYLNPGSVARPRWGSECSYMTLEEDLFLWKTLEGEEYRRYRL